MHCLWYMDITIRTRSYIRNRRSRARTGRVHRKEKKGSVMYSRSISSSAAGPLASRTIDRRRISFLSFLVSFIHPFSRSSLCRRRHVNEHGGGGRRTRGERDAESGAHNHRLSNKEEEESEPVKERGNGYGLAECTDTAAIRKRARRHSAALMNATMSARPSLVPSQRQRPQGRRRRRRRRGCLLSHRTNSGGPRKRTSEAAFPGTSGRPAM